MRSAKLVDIRSRPFEVLSEPAPRREHAATPPTSRHLCYNSQLSPNTLTPSVTDAWPGLVAGSRLGCIQRSTSLSRYSTQDLWSLRVNPILSNTQRSGALGGISIHDLTVRYQNGFPILEQLSLEIAPREVLALVGASGCGKSTFLRTLAGLIAPSVGHVRLSQETGEQNPLRHNLSYVFQDATLLPWRTVFDNVRLPLELKRQRQSGAEESEAVAAALHAVGLEEASWRKFPRQLSGGMRMRNSIARALVTNPDVLLLDEPFAALDDLLRTRMNELILKLWHERPRTILFVTHNIAEAITMSHRVAVFGGRRIARIIDNPLAWPRTAKQRTTLEFAEQYGAVSQTLSEVAAS